MKSSIFLSKAGKTFMLALLMTCFAVLPKSRLFAQQDSAVKNIVIVHGAFADGSGWENVFTILKSAWL